MSRRYKTKIPIPTLHSWLKRYQDICTFYNLRKRFTIDPNNIIVSKKFYHQQVYEFKYHKLKLNIAGKRYPKLKSYLQYVIRNLDNCLFQQGIRCSEYSKKLNQNLGSMHSRKIRDSNAIKIAQLGLVLARTNSMRHEAIENFFLINDTPTIAIEIPFYLNPHEAKSLRLSITQPITGHIDILQLRGNRVHILDYKPGAQGERKTLQQLSLYALALHRRTGIEFSNISCGYFDYKNYFQITPTL